MRATSIRATSIRAIEVFEGFILEYRIPAFVRDKGFKRLVYCALNPQVEHRQREDSVSCHCVNRAGAADSKNV